MCFASLFLALVVGISEICSSNGSVRVGAEYTEAVRRAGDVPLVICRTATDADLDTVLSKIDLLLLPGGEDVEPARYGAEKSPNCGNVNLVRDDFEYRLLAAAVRRELPIVGICRGSQVINTFFGGTLYQDLPTELPESMVTHRDTSSPKARQALRHEMTVADGSRLAKVLGEKRVFTVNSIHHQAMKGIAPGFRVAARAPDGVVEAIECDWYPVAAVQFHPEKLSVNESDKDWARFFRKLKIFAGKTNALGRKFRPIGVFDSGTGGLTVLEKLLERPELKEETFVYLGDQANMPYGRYAAEGKSAFLTELAKRDAQFVMGCEGHSPAKIVVIACNTATAYGLEAISAMPRPYDTKVIGVVNAGVSATLDALKDEKEPFAIGVIATPGTISSGVYERTLRQEIATRALTTPIEIVNRGGVGLAEAVENDEPTMADCARTNLVALIEGYRARGGKAPMKAIIMGCTHYPFVLDTFKTTLAALKADPAYASLIADDLLFVDPAVYTAEACVAALKADGLLRTAPRQKGRRLRSFISIGKEGPLSDAVKYGRDTLSPDIGTRVVPMTDETMSRDALDRLGKLLPLTKAALDR